MTAMPNAVDVSRWGGELSAKEAACLKAAGVRLLIVGTGFAGVGGAGQWARQQAQSWLDAGGEFVDAYVFLYFTNEDGVATQIRVALATMAGLPVRRWWLDIEDTSATVPAMTVEEREYLAVSATTALERANVAHGIYTGRWYWIPSMGNSAMFNDLPLWNSYYDGNPDVTGLPYGGWTTSAIEQYQGTTVLCGQSVDLNYAYDLDGPVEEDMTPAEVQTIVDAAIQAYADKRESIELLELLEQMTGIVPSTFDPDNQARVNVILAHMKSPGAPYQVYADTAAALLQASKAMSFAGQSRTPVNGGV